MPSSSNGSASNQSQGLFTLVESLPEGEILRTSKIEVKFKKPIQESSTGTVTPSWEFEPKIDGTSQWLDGKTLLFSPDKPLKPSQKYIGKLRLGDSPSQLLNFSFQVLRQNIDLKFEDLKLLPNSQSYVLQGEVSTSQFSEDGLVEDFIKAHQSGTPLALTWDHREGGRYHRFTIADIARKNEVSALELEWNGEALGAKTSGRKRIEVPPLNMLTVISAKTFTREQSYVELSFSQAVDPNQDMTGLVRLDGVSLKPVVEGSIIKLFVDETFNETKTLRVSEGLKGADGSTLKAPFEQALTFQALKPGIRFHEQANIIPYANQALLPFESVQLHSIQVTAFRIDERNIPQFLQVNNLDDGYELKRVGRFVWRKTVTLQGDVSSWQRRFIDVTEVTQKYPGSLFRFILTANRGNSSYSCQPNESSPSTEPGYKDSDQQAGYSAWNSYVPVQSWNHRHDPCHDSYYQSKQFLRKEKNIFVSDIGVIAKANEKNQFDLVVNSFRDSEPVSGASLAFYNFQNQLMHTGESDQQGFYSVELPSRPFLIVASKGKNKSYLKVNSRSQLSVAHFDVSGHKVQKGLNGFIYGERGVWRPGDDIYLTFIGLGKPQGSQVTLDFFNPSGVLVNTYNPSRALNDFYSFKISTDKGAKTGNWKATVNYGGVAFHKTIKVEMVRPNRLKMNLSTEDTLVLGRETSMKLESQWLHGAPASQLKADVKVKLKPNGLGFESFDRFTFQDPSRRFELSQAKTIFEGKLNETGAASFKTRLVKVEDAPGRLNASFELRVFEKSGAFSIGSKSVDVHPYSHYVGIQVPKGDEARGMLLTDKEHPLSIVTVDRFGQPSPGRKISVNLFKISWKWWWDKSKDNWANFSSSRHVQSILSGQLRSKGKNAQANWPFQIKYPDWGRYLIKACDVESGHCAAKVIYMDWPGWAGRAAEKGSDAATRLQISSSKKSWTVGEDAEVFFPATTHGRFLLSLENGSEVLDKRWIEAKPGKNRVSFKISPEMAPNIFAHITLIQPYSDRENDHPLRMYGVIPILVNNPETTLSPVITTSDVWKPNSPVEIEISEENAKAMTYTIAVVDEGLLGLTNYSSPNPHGHFYQKAALGVKTWDQFDHVIGAYGAELEQIIGIGGDGNANKEATENDANRFPPFIRFLGPFSLAAGDKQEHLVEIPNYMGEARIMVTAGAERAFGNQEKSVPVKDDVVLLVDGPRVLRPGEVAHLPVSVFNTADVDSQVNLKFKSNARLKLLGLADMTLDIRKGEDKVALIPVQVSEGTKPGTLEVIAEARGQVYQQKISIPIEIPNPVIQRVSQQAIEKGGSWNVDLEPFGIEGSNELLVEASSIPPLQLDRRLHYLIKYPHGCLEQTTSGAFPQLYVDRLMDLDETVKKSIEVHIKSAIAKIASFQTSSGAFTRWMGDDEIDPWASIYAAHFLLEAETAGYHVSAELRHRWVNFQKDQANRWTPLRTGQSQLIQAYRLAVLALAKQADLGAMNRLREIIRPRSAASAQLATAYAIIGQKEVATDLLSSDSIHLSSYREHKETYGSRLRDQAILLMSYGALSNRTLGMKLVKEMSDELNSGSWLSTQETAFALMAIAKFLGPEEMSKKLSIAMNIGEQTETIISDRAIWQKQYPDFRKPLLAVFENKSTNPVFLNIVRRGTPPMGDEQALNQGLEMTLKLVVDQKELNALSGDLRVRHGSDLQAKVTIRNPSRKDYKSIALTHIFPSGFEVKNERLQTEKSETDQADYVDIRDDRTLTYFDLPSGGQKSFNVDFNAAYPGRFYYPAIQSELMYEGEINSNTKGFWIDIE
ncbi:hypothetical protein SAMN06296036_112116 [Pseudobacteriovorax antillogorgiicola]|uniref:Alpha-2-macroglobulin n=2 Tax=Pseudobacteriovorax antillogorgiicola TaxID=1513793 RepID=A0A1Y6C992_9BACT|nr:hypothetical protein EDD56_112117 [Pseudobacteriovorax antillogorgiicola]SMF40960.1 hypothetical protein SAMN06296036_112116 [Pseudobacteriovorax antillogorgiicola]